MSASVWGYALVCLIAVGGGWVLATPPSNDGLVAPTTRVRVASYEREGAQLSMALGDFNALGYVAPTAAPESAEMVAPQVDVAFAFRRDLTAIVKTRSRTIVWVVDRETGDRRALRRGSVFMDDWRIASIEDQEIVLRRENEERRVSIVGAPPAPPTSG